MQFSIHLDGRTAWTEGCNATIIAKTSLKQAHGKEHDHDHYSRITSIRNAVRIFDLKAKRPFGQKHVHILSPARLYNLHS